MNFIDFEISVILALVGAILTLLVSIFNNRLTKRREAEKEKQLAEKEKEKQRKDQYNKWLGPSGIPPKDEREAVLIARSEGRNVNLPSISGSILLLLLIFIVSSISYFIFNAQTMHPVPNTETSVPIIINTSIHTDMLIPTMTVVPTTTVETTFTPISQITMIILPSDTTIPFTPIAPYPTFTPILVPPAIFTAPPPLSTGVPTPFTPTLGTELPTLVPSSTNTLTPFPAPFVELLSVVYWQIGTDPGCQAWIGVQVSGGPVTGNPHVWNASYGPDGVVYPSITLDVGMSGFAVTLGGMEPQYYVHEVWFEYNGTSSNRLTNLVCPGSQ